MVAADLDPERAAVVADQREVEGSNDRRRTDMMYHFVAMGTVIAPAPVPAGARAIPSWISVPLRDAPRSEISL